ncbi:MAG: hypothetical protein GY876_09880 [Planctomycetes bacterium]|nr:hypothetical protein [Planctomycetota bacterium]
MKNSKEYAAKFASQIKKLKKRSDPLDMSGPLEVLIYSQLLWESNASQADEAWDSLLAARLDWHEIRVSTPGEIAEMCGDTSAEALDRGARLKAMLNHLYQRHHEVTIDPELELGKRDLRASIEALDGMTPYVATRWLLLCGEIGGVPVDEQLCWMLGNAGCIDDSASVDEVSAWVSRQVKSDDAYRVHATLQAWVNGQSDRVSKRRAKDLQAAERAAKKKRGDIIASRNKAQKVAAEKRKEAAERAAARKAAAALAEQEALEQAAKKTTKKTAKKTTKKTTKKATTKTTKKTSKKVAKKPAKKAAKKTTKKTTKKPAKKTAKKPAKKAAKKTAKKTAKKAAKKKTSKKRSTSRSRK